MATVDVRTAAKTKLYVSAAAPATYDTAGYEALTFTQVQGVDTIPGIGPTHNTINFNDLGSGGLIKQRGSEDPGEPEMDIGDIPGDAGQVILKAAHDAAKGTAAERLSIKVIDDAGYITYCEGSIGAWSRSWAGTDEIIRRSAKILVQQGSIVEDTP